MEEAHLEAILDSAELMNLCGNDCKVLLQHTLCRRWGQRGDQGIHRQFTIKNTVTNPTPFGALTWDSIGHLLAGDREYQGLSGNLKKDRRRSGIRLARVKNTWLSTGTMAFDGKSGDPINVRSW